MKKDGELTLEELVKIILAVAGIAILLLLAFNLYKAFSVKTELEQAKIHLDRIEKSLKKMNDGQTIEYLLTGPKGWYLVGYEALEISSNLGKYNSTVYCENKDCICFCNMKGYGVREFIYTSSILNPSVNSLDRSLGDKISNALKASTDPDVEIRYSQFLLSGSILYDPNVWERIANLFGSDSLDLKMKYFFYQQEPYGVFKNPGYLKCESESVCFKMEELKIFSYEEEAGFSVPWIGLNNSATNIKILKKGNNYTISKKLR